MGAGLALAAPLLAGAALANPLGAAVTTGSASISAPSSKYTQVHQTSEDVVIDWSSFNIGAGQTTNFLQPNAQALAVNRIGGANAARIMGTLDANGRVVLIDGNGILFGKGAVVDVGSLVATSSGGTDQQLLAGKFVNAGNTNATIVNRGMIDADTHGTVALVAPNVTNSGTVEAKLGTVSLGGADAFTVDFKGDGLVSFAAQGTGPARVANSGSIRAANISLTARAAEGIATGIVSVGGTLEARGARSEGGTIILDAGDGGAVDVTHAKLDASGADGGGAIRIGGWNEISVSVNKRSVLDTSARRAGDGGAISVIAQATRFEGKAHARGGSRSGNGGTIETSGNVVDTLGARIDTLAANGRRGTWTLDPENVRILAAATSGGSISGGIFTPTSANSVLNASTLENALASSNVDVTTGTTGTQAGNITVLAPLTWASGNTLTLDAARSILFDKNVTVTGAGGLDLITGKHGTISFGSTSDHVTFDNLASALSINGAAYTLVDNIATLATDIAADPTGDFALAADYNAAADGTYRRSPVVTVFNGAFEGLGNTITNLKIKAGQNYVGLFAYLNKRGTITNINLANANVTGTVDQIFVGTLLGKNEGTVSFSSSSGTLTGAGDSLGGLVGDNGGTGTIEYSQSAVNVTDNDTSGVFAYVGGLTGANYHTILSSSATGGVLETAGSDSDIGGLVGWNNGGSVTLSFATGNVTTNSNGDFDDVGGLVGRSGYGAGSAISDSYASGNVNGGGFSASVGGLVGAVTETSSVTGSQASGTATGDGQYAFVGGLVGDVTDTTGSVTNSSASGAVTGGLDSYDGGLIGANAGTVSGSTATGSVTGGAGSCTGPLIGYPNNTQPGCE